VCIECPAGTGCLAELALRGPRSYGQARRVGRYSQFNWLENQLAFHFHPSILLGSPASSGMAVLRDEFRAAAAFVALLALTAQITAVAGETTEPGAGYVDKPRFPLKHKLILTLQLSYRSDTNRIGATVLHHPG
jgi:hypothetical protein